MSETLEPKTYGTQKWLINRLMFRLASLKNSFWGYVVLKDGVNNKSLVNNKVICKTVHKQDSNFRVKLF